ncbi:MAG: hypothetical protein ABIP82_06715, partial [Nitrospirales bacterium]
MTIKPWLPSILYLLALGIGGVLAFTHIPIHSQLHALLPSTENATQQALSDQLQSGQTSRMLLLGLQGATREVLGEANKQLAQAMRDSGRFVYVHNGEHSSLKNDQALLYRYRYLLSPSLHPFQFQGKALQEALQRRVSDISNLLPLPIKQKILEDPTQAFPPYAQMLKGGNSLNTQHGVWFSAQKDLTLLVAETMAPGFDLDTQEDIQSLMTFQVEILRATLPGASALELLRTGSSLFAIQSRTLIQHDARWLSSLGTLGVVTLLFLTYRSAGLILLTMIPLATALLASSLAVYAVFGYLHGITLAFGATLIGVAIDYPIHLFTHLHPPDPPATTMKRIWPTI